MENPKATGRLKWRVVALCWGALVMTSIIRISLGIAAPTLMKEYDISPSTMGYILSGWNWAYTSLQLIVGPLVDRFGAWIVLGTGAGVWSLSTIALPLATTATGLFMFRAFFGIGHSMLIPAQGSLISRWFRSEQRSTALGFAFSGSQVGSFFGAAICAFILSRFGWQSIFYWIGGANLLFAAIWIFFHPERKIGIQVKPDRETQTKTTQRASVISLLRYRSAWGLAFGQMGYLYAYHVFLSWLPSYLVMERNMSIALTGIFAGLPFLMGILGTIGGGWLGDDLIRRGFSHTIARKTVVGIGMVAATIMVVTAAYTSQTWLAITLLTFCMGSLRATTGSANAMPIDLVPSASVASLVSIQNFGGNIGGLMAPIITGYILAATGSFTGALVTAGAVMSFGAFSYVFIVGRLPEKSDQLLETAD
ncbi:MAG: MFS transporter [Acidobacteriota bacterium]|nr:MFS transporter [Acidobacteriota bacterium]